MELTRNEVRQVIQCRVEELHNQLDVLIPAPVTYEWLSSWKDEAEKQLQAVTRAMIELVSQYSGGAADEPR